VTVRANPPTGITGQAVQFTANRTGGIAPFSYEWAFGDVSPGNTSASPSHVYADPGNYSVTLVLTDQKGERATGTLTVPVLAAPNPLTAAPSFRFLIGACPAESFQVEFTANAVGGVPPLTDRWSFSDGTTATGAVVLHSYVTTANLSVNDSRGQVYHAEVTTTPPPPLPPCGGQPLFGTGSWAVLAGIGLAVALGIVVLAYVVVRRRRRMRDEGPGGP
jgi:immune inhibitor A